MTDEELEMYAKIAAQHVNGGDFDNKDFYNEKHRESWIEAMRKVFDTYSKTTFHHPV